MIVVYYTCGEKPHDEEYKKGYGIRTFNEAYNAGP